MIRPGKREKVDISRDFYTTIFNRYNLKDANEDDWGKYQAMLSKNVLAGCYPTFECFTKGGTSFKNHAGSGS